MKTARRVPLARAIFWLFCAGALAIAIALASGKSPGLWPTIAFGVVFFAFATLGVLFPQTQMYGDVLCRGTPGRQRIALTFDDGPHPVTTRRILAILAEHRVQATFFVVGRKVELYPDVVKEIVAAGHSLGIHGYFHDRVYSLRSGAHVQADIERTRRAISAACNVETQLFRPPVGFLSLATARAALRAQLVTVAWSARGFDGVASANVERVVERIDSQLHDGAIVLLHDAAERDDFIPASLEALPRILELIERQHLNCVKVDEFAAEWRA